jgi:hypothetical protein
MVDGSCWGGGAPFTLHRRAMAAAERKKDSVPEAQKVGPERGGGPARGHACRRSLVLPNGILGGGNAPLA